nr:hypothetical protein Iba_chr09bCG12070 [Ipomoea batatas]
MVAAAPHPCFAGPGGLAGHRHRSLLRLLIWVAEGGKVNIEDDGGGRNGNKAKEIQLTPESTLRNTNNTYNLLLIPSFQHRKEVAEQISSSMATKNIMPDQIKGEIPPTSSSWKTTYLQTNLSFPSFIALLFLKVDNSLARQYTPVLECKRNSEG